MENKMQGCWLDKTWCVSPNCKDECGRKFTEEMKEAVAKIPSCRISLAYFCGETEK
jgi:hypothetical protein